MRFPPLTIERQLSPPHERMTFEVRGGGRWQQELFLWLAHHYGEAELIARMVLLTGSPDDLSEQLASVRHYASELQRFGLPPDDVAYVLACELGHSQRRAATIHAPAGDRMSLPVGCRPITLERCSEPGRMRR